MTNIELIIKHLENNKEDRPILQKKKINREFLVARYPRLLLVGIDKTIEEIIGDCLDIDRKIRRAKQLHPHLAGDSDSDKAELEENAKEDLGYTQTP